MMTLPRVHLPDPIDDDATDHATGGARVSRFDVERLACGELRGDDAARVQQAIDRDPALQAFLQELRADDAAFLLQQPPAAFMARLAAATPTPTMTPWARTAAFFAGLRLQLAAGAMAVAVLVAVVALPRTGGDDDDGPIRGKGGERQPTLSFFVKEDGGARLGSAGEILKAGDQIQLAVTDATPRALVVVGVDSAGVVSVYASEVTTTVPKGETGPRPLPAALVLDDVVGAERFFVVYGDDLAALERAARGAAARLADDVKAGRGDLTLTTRLDIDDALPQASIHILKVR
jgi:hypothetical protein